MTREEIESTLGIQAPRLQSIELDDQRLDVLRLDNMHDVVQGNKWFKLMYNLLAVKEGGFSKALSFGGAFSNHLHAFAYACHALGIPSIGVIRGEEPDQLSPTLQDARAWGMQLEFISRESYAEKETEDFKGWVRDTFGDVFIIPEGGANFLGVNGCMEISSWIPEDAEIICCSAGTGTMAAGLLMRLKEHQKLMVFPALKGLHYMQHEIHKRLHYFLMDEHAATELMEGKLILQGDYHFGGYAKSPPELLEYMRQFEEKMDFSLDRVYTSKLFFGVQQVFRQESEWKNKRVLVIHSGGLQGNRAITAS